MGFLKRLTAKKGTPDRPRKPPAAEPVPSSGPRPDPLGFDPVGHQWVEQLKAGDWEGYPSFLAGLERLEERDFYVAGIAEAMTDRPAWLDTWVERDSADALPLYVRGEHSVVWAWAARSNARADYVGRAQWDLFHQGLRDALGDLAAAARLAPDDPGIRAAMIPIGNGLQMDMDERLRNWRAIADVDPWHVGGGHSMIQTLAPKWSGSLDAMLGFAREVSASAPEGHPIHVIVADAHIEASLEEQSPDYFRRPGVLEEVRAAAARSIDHASYTPHRRTARDVNTFAMIEWEVRNLERVHELLRRSGDWITWPWTMSPKPVALFDLVRTRAGLA